MKDWIAGGTNPVKSPMVEDSAQESPTFLTFLRNPGITENTPEESDDAQSALVYRGF